MAWEKQMKQRRVNAAKRDAERSQTDQRLAAFGYRIGMLHRLHNLCMRGPMAEMGLSVALIPVLGELFHKDGITQDALSELAQLDKGSTARAVEKLERKGLVRRIENGANRRQKFVYLTAKAHEKKDTFFSPLYGMSFVMSKDFTLNESRMMLRFMDIMTENLRAELAAQRSAK
jgi:DNA-binding MarR family transcriptional regulator